MELTHATREVKMQRKLRITSHNYTQHKTYKQHNRKHNDMQPKNKTISEEDSKDIL